MWNHRFAASPLRGEGKRDSLAGPRKISPNGVVGNESLSASFYSTGYLDGFETTDVPKAPCCPDGAIDDGAIAGSVTG